MSWLKFVSLNFLSVIIILFSDTQALGNNPSWLFMPLDKGWKLEFRTGAGMLLTEIPDEYLMSINQVNPPIHDISSSNIFSLKKSVTPHLEIGYQLEYINISGNSEKDDVLYWVRTQALSNSFLFLYNFKKTDKFKPPFNYFVCYKFGSISLKNIPREIVADGESPTNVTSAYNDKFLSNIAVLTGLGFGVNYRLSEKLNLTGAFEFNRNSIGVGDIYKVYKLFYNSKNTVNNYISLTLGLAYTFNLSKQKKSSITKSRSEMDYKLFQYRKKVLNKKSSRPRHSVWYDE